MLNIGNERIEKETSLNDRRLECIERGALNWIGKGFLTVIKNDCQASINLETQKKNKAK